MIAHWLQGVARIVSFVASHAESDLVLAEASVFRRFLESRFRATTLPLWQALHEAAVCTADITRAVCDIVTYSIVTSGRLKGLYGQIENANGREEEGHS